MNTLMIPSSDEGHQTGPMRRGGGRLNTRQGPYDRRKQRRYANDGRWTLWATATPGTDVATLPMELASGMMPNGDEMHQTGSTRRGGGRLNTRRGPYDRRKQRRYANDGRWTPMASSNPMSWRGDFADGARKWTEMHQTRPMCRGGGGFDTRQGPYDRRQQPQHVNDARLTPILNGKPIESAKRVRSLNYSRGDWWCAEGGPERQSCLHLGGTGDT